MKESLTYDIRPPCHPAAPIAFRLPIEIDDLTGSTTYPAGAELREDCRVCGKPYAAMNKGADLRVRALDVADPAKTFALLDEDLG